MKIRSLTVKYGDKTVLDSLDLNIENTEKVAILGKSGAGKTSLVKALLSLVDFDGKIDNVPTFSVIFQEDRLVEEISVERNILLACPCANASDVLALVGLENNAKDKVKTLSGGMKRRVAVARALAKNGEMLIGDEPFTGLDVSAKTHLTQGMKTYLKDKGLLLITHDLLQAYALCERIVIIDNGKVALDKRTSEFTLEQTSAWFYAQN